MFKPTFQWITSGLAGLVLSTSMFVMKPVQAQVKISPMVISTETEQGQATGVISITNLSNQEARMRLSTRPFTYSRDGFETLESSANDLSQYMVFSPNELILDPGQTRRVRLYIRLLPSTPAGEYRTVVLAEPLIEREVQSGLSLVTNVGVTIYVRHGEVSHNMTVQGASYDSQQSQINLLVSNSGNATVRPGVRWRLLEGTEVIATDEISDITIIAEGERNIPIRFLEQDQKPTPGDYELTGELFWGDSQNPQALPFDVDVTIPAQTD